MHDTSPNERSDSATPENAPTEMQGAQNKSPLWLWIASILVIGGMAFGVFRLMMEPAPLDRSTMPAPSQADAPGTTRVLHERTGCSFALPAGWSILDEPGKSKAFVGPKEQDFIPNIQVDVVPFTGSLDEFGIGGMLTLKSKFKDFMLLQQESVITTKGQSGVSMTALYTPTSRRLRFSFYYFRKDQDSIIMVICTSPDDSSKELVSLLEACVKSMEIK